MFNSLTDIELVARHRIAERVRYSPAHPSAADAPPRCGVAPRREDGPDPGQDLIATPRRQ